MARPDRHTSGVPVFSYSSTSYDSSAARSKPRVHAGPANPHRPATVFNPPHEQPPPIPTEGISHLIYPELYDLSSMNHSATVATGQPHPGFSLAFETNGDYHLGWDYGQGDLETTSTGLSPQTFQGEVRGTQAQAPWYHAIQTYPVMVPDTIQIAEPMPEYLPVGESMGGCFDWLQGPPPMPMGGQMSPSSSQSSYYTSSPVSGGAPLYSRPNSCASVPARVAAAVEQARFDGRLQPVPDQVFSSTGDGWPSPAGSVASSSTVAQPRRSSLASAAPRKQKRDQATMMTTTATNDYDAGTLSPAMTPSPANSTTVTISDQQALRSSSRRHSNHQTPYINKRENPPVSARRGSQQKQASTGGPAQAKEKHKHKHKHKQQEQEPPPHVQPKQRRLEPGAQADDQQQGQDSQAPKLQPLRTRNRAAAIKCRAKTKQAEADLESTERAMSTEHQELSATARGLRDEVLRLKYELLAHGNCDDGLIQQYLTGQAVMVGSSVGQGQQPQHHHHHHHHHHRPR